MKHNAKVPGLLAEMMVLTLALASTQPHATVNTNLQKRFYTTTLNPCVE